MVQNSALRVILKADKRTSIKSMHDAAKILSLEQRRKLNMAVDCFKQVSIENSSLTHMFEKSTSNRITRRSNESNVKVPDLRTMAGRKAYSYRGPVFWNNIEKDIKAKTTKNSFKTAYTKFLLCDVNHQV